MIKKIIACGDLHIRNLRRMEEYQIQLSKFIRSCKEECKKYKSDEVRIVITGDIFHNKLDISSEAYVLANWFFKELNLIAKTYVIAGNHDLNMRNLQRISPIDTLLSIGQYKNIVFLDNKLGYISGLYEDDNVVWCLYSSFENFARPKIEECDDDKYLVGLLHGTILGSKTDTGYTSENGLSDSYFEGLNVCFCGHIHKHQTLTYNETDIIYTGSLIQQDHGENISGHGYLVWDVEEEECTFHPIENKSYGFYTFQIESEDDLDNDKEEILNL